jgi:hypothetical protein
MAETVGVIANARSSALGQRDRDAGKQFLVRDAAGTVSPYRLFL